MADFDLIVSQSLSHALGTLAQNPEAWPIAGVTDFLPAVEAGRWQAELALDISRLAELRYIRRVKGGLEIGALTRHADLKQSPLIREHIPVLGRAAGMVAGPQIQGQATLGGNICTASPAADTVPPLMVLEAELILRSQAGERRLPLADFLLGPGQTARQPDELLTAIYIPEPPAKARMNFEKLGKRKALIISIVNGAALLVLDGDRIGQARLSLGAVAPRVVRCPAAEAVLAGQPPTAELFAQAAEAVLETISPIDDVRGTAAYRRAAAVGLTRRILAGAWRQQ